MNKKKHEEPEKDKEKKKKEEVSEANGILFKKRKLFLFDTINEKTAPDIVKGLIALDSIGKDPIHLYINSNGGYVTDAMSIIDAICGVRSEVITIICGRCYSAASFLALHGDLRLMTPNSWWMGHEIANNPSDYLSKLRCTMEQSERLWKSIEKMYKKKTKLTNKDIELIRNGELWLDVEQCYKKGIIDKILK